MISPLLMGCKQLSEFEKSQIMSYKVSELWLLMKLSYLIYWMIFGNNYHMIFVNYLLKT